MLGCAVKYIASEIK